MSSYVPRTPTIDGCTYKESVQAVSVEGGVAGNVVPDRVVLRVHHRFAPDRSSLSVDAKLGWTDVARFAELGIPAANFGPGDAPIAHTRAEYVERDAINYVYASLLSLVESQ